MNQYKDIIRDQDSKIKSLTESLSRLEYEKSLLQSQLSEAMSSNSQLSDQNILLKAQLTAASETVRNSNHINHLENQMSSISIDHQTQISFYQSENSRLLNEIENFKVRLLESERLVMENNNEMDKLRKDQEDLLELLSDQDTKLNQYKQQLRALGQHVEQSDDDEDDETDEDTK